MGSRRMSIRKLRSGKVGEYYNRQQFDVSSVEWNDISKVYAVPIQTSEFYKLIYQARKF